MPHSNRVDAVPQGNWDPRIRLFANDDLVQIAVVITARYVVLVDTLINPATAHAVMRAIEPDLAGRQLLVINTHADYDHAWGNQLFAGPDARYPAPIIAHRHCAARLTAIETQIFLQGAQRREPAIFADVVLTPPTVLFDMALTIDGGDLSLELHHTPGHTADHAAIYLPQIQTLLAGDAAELPFPAAEDPRDLPVMRASIAQLAALRPAHTLYCHAPNDYGPRLLADNLDYFDQIENACRAAVEEGVPWTGLNDRGLIAAMGCRFEDVTPSGAAWAAVGDDYRIEHHAAQLRDMLAWLQA